MMQLHGKTLFILAFIWSGQILISWNGVAQSVTQTIRGTIIEKETHTPLPGAHVMVMENASMVTISDNQGNFKLDHLPLGRYTIQASFLGFETVVVKELLLTSVKEVVLTIEMQESVRQIEVVEISSNSAKDKPLNTMANISARQCRIEETSRYAGGFDDPARLASVFAGSSSTMSNNGIVIRGNAPRGLGWRMEGVEISNPSHFADVTAFGAGGITALSAQMLANSDFFTGAFPAEYGNALSGIFDLKLRNGNNEKYEHTVSIGTIGTDISSEGPLGKQSKASYLFNYRFSTFALLAPLLPDDAGGIWYQDFSFKLNFPLKKAGTFSIWGIGANDRSGTKPEKDTTLWFYDQDREDSKALTKNGAIGLSHKMTIKKRSFLQTSVSFSGNGIQYNVKRAFTNDFLLPVEDIFISNNKYSVSSTLNYKFGVHHSNKTGITVDFLNYTMGIKHDEDFSGNFISILNSNGTGKICQLFNQSKIDFHSSLTASIGLHLTYFSINNKTILEPRGSARWQINKKNSFTFGYGRHSQIEMLNFYFTQVAHPGSITYPNKNLGFTIAQHFVLGYNTTWSSEIHMKIEAYLQQLSNVPVIPGKSFSMLNLDKDWFFKDSLANSGTGKNYGIDITIEKFLSHGYYWLTTLTFFNSRYTGGDGIERNTRYNRRYVINVLTGKEWRLGRNQQHCLGINGRLNFTGGDWITPVNIPQSLFSKTIIEKEELAFNDQKPGLTYADVTITYTRNRHKLTSVWSVKLMNVFFAKELAGFRYNYKTSMIDKEETITFVPNLSYKIEF